MLVEAWKTLHNFQIRQNIFFCEDDLLTCKNQPKNEKKNN